jgi:hypothetical protein
MPRQQMSSQQMPSMQPPQFEAQQLTQLEHAEMDEASNNEEFFSAHPEQPEQQQHANYSGSQQEFQIRTESQMPGSVRKHMLTRQSSKEKKKMATFQGFSLGMGLGMANTIKGK